MRTLLSLVLLALLNGPAAAQARRPLLVLSIDGLDNRYLKDADKMGLRIPTLRRLMKEGQWASEGVVGVAPTVTWPSHTSMITGVRPEEHGILSNRRPREEGGEYYWTASLLKTKTLWHAVREVGWKSAAITWPVTVDAAIDYNLPEYFQRRNGGAMDLDSIQTKSVPSNLVETISKRYPSFAHQWMDDRSRALATMAILQEYRPDLMLVHFVDLDSEQHERGPFTREAKAMLEYTDELVAGILRVMPKNYVLALVSDHGFERVDRVVNINVLLKRDNVRGTAEASGALLTTTDPAVAEYLRKRIKDPAYGIAREIPKAELQRFAPRLLKNEAVFEPVLHTQFGSATEGEAITKPGSRGSHGYWPTRENYRSVLLFWGNGIRPSWLPETEMVNIAPLLAQILGLKFSPTPLPESR